MFLQQNHHLSAFLFPNEILIFFVDLIIGPNFSHFLPCTPCCGPHPGQCIFLVSQSWAYLYDLFWPMEWGGNDMLTVSSLEFKMLCVFCLLCLCHDHEKNFLWRVLVLHTEPQRELMCSQSTQPASDLDEKAETPQLSQAEEESFWLPTWQVHENRCVLWQVTLN